jgi:hypothetical protein
LPKKEIKKTMLPFHFRTRIGEYEIELKGSHEEVLKTIKELPNLMVDVVKAFEEQTHKQKTTTVKVKKAATKEPLEKFPLKVRTTTSKETLEKFPKLSHPENCSKAILSVLETDWGKWRPRTRIELRDALKANKIDYSVSTLSTTLKRLSKKGKVKRWKTDAGYVYILPK